jgi:2-phosphosulfolactate phosphatase
VRVDVVLGPQQLTPAEVSGRVVAVIDVLRASTTVAVALANGARAVVPFESSEEVVLRSKSFERGEVRLAGERKMLPVSGFDFGNSPLEFTREAVEGKTVLFSTTNGTPTLLAAQGARDVVVASYANFSAALALLRTAARGGAAVTIACSGRERQFSLEDAACAGRYARHLTRGISDVELNDAARAAMLVDAHYGDDLQRLFAESVHGRALAEAGFGGDLVLCGGVDAYPVVPIYADRQITRLGPGRER